MKSPPCLGIILFGRKGCKSGSDSIISKKWSVYAKVINRFDFELFSVITLEKQNSNRTNRNDFQ